MAEAGGGGGGGCTQILAEYKAPSGSSGAPHYYLPTQIFRPCAPPELKADVPFSSKCDKPSITSEYIN
jgi:hypothetical protein